MHGMHCAGMVGHKTVVMNRQAVRLISFQHASNEHCITVRVPRAQRILDADLFLP